MKRLCAIATLLTTLAQLVLVLLSWILSATQTEGIHSLLTSEAARWLFSQFTNMVASKWLVWLLLAAMAMGPLLDSGMMQSLITMGKAITARQRLPLPYRERVAWLAVAAVTTVYVAIILLLTVMPHAVLLSATGRLMPSPFSQALVPIAAFAVVLTSATYGLMSGRLPTLVSVADSLSNGIAKAAPLFPLGVVMLLFCHSASYVFGL